MSRKPVDPHLQWVNPDGTPTLYFTELMQQVMANLPTKRVSVTEPTATQTLKYNATTDQYEPG